MKVPYHPQQFTRESHQNHHQIELRPTNKSIDQQLLQSATQKFHHSHVDYLQKPIVSIQTTNEQKPFSEEIFPSINSNDNPLSEITKYFRNQLAESWNKLFSDEQTEREDPSIEEISSLLRSIREESAKFWEELIASIRSSNEQLFDTGLAIRITPSTLIYSFQQRLSSFQWTIDQHTLLGGTIVSWTLEQQLERALHFAIHDKRDELKKETLHIPHSNWIPSSHVPWLILELEMNITIREMQIKVAEHMMQPAMTTDDCTLKSIVMQMNMGEGKTSVILPMLAVSLSSSSESLIRMIVLKSLFPTNYQSLRSKLGGLLNRRIFPFACRRDLNFNNEQINQIFTRLNCGLENCDVILTSPEDILSFDLLIIDKCRRNEFETGRSMLTMQRWMKKYIRDVLDESDEILHVKYQLIYTVGGQQQMDGGAERWKTIQSILEFVKKHAEKIYKDFSEEICYRPADRQSAFPQFRFQSAEPFPSLCKMIANDWLNQRSYRQGDKQSILSFILDTNSSIEPLVDRFPLHDIQLFLIVRGLLSSEVLLVTLKKRYRVNYGVNPNPMFNRLMAVPFRAKDVAADRTEFGHPDVALVLTHLTYYYSGLNEKQLYECFNRLNDEETNPESIYDQWIFYEGERNDISMSIRQWKGVNLKDYQQRTRFLFPTFQHNKSVIDYFLNHFVFSREAKQFPDKLVASAWDLSSSDRSKIITGFSGTNDTQLLLPVHIRQHDLPELQKTDAIVVNNLLQPENECYQTLPINASADKILEQIVKLNINVILDVGALFIDGSNRDIAIQWLDLSKKEKIDYVIYFDLDSSIVVCDRQYHQHRFETSPANERLDRCVFYLDEIHTRGTDFKFPRGFKAALTLGNGLTKDRFVQAAMRMRKLGCGHSLTFWSSNEVHQQILALKKYSSIMNNGSSINVIDILRWVYENTVQSTWDGLHHWAAQSLSFQRKLAAFRTIQWNDQQQVFTDSMMEQLAKECLEPEIIELKRMYGVSKVRQTVLQIHFARYQLINHYRSAEIEEDVIKRLKDYGGIKQRLSQLLDEEQQRELEQELEEERQLARPPPVEPCQPILHAEIKRLSDIYDTMMDLNQFPGVFRRLAYALTGTTFFDIWQANSWEEKFWISTEFQRVIATKGESLNTFLRPPRWLILYRNEYLIFLSPYEANWLIDRLSSNKSTITTLRLLLPRAKRIQSIFVNTSTLTIPPSIGLSDGLSAFTLGLQWLVQLFLFNGTLYFENVGEQNMFCQCLALCSQPRTPKEKEAFEKGWISVDGFVKSPEHRRQLQIHHARFDSNPLTFVKELIENRNNIHAPISSHVGSIIFNSIKLL
ncbi:unnamed protein product [Rotaria sordida]|uniref:ubiquitinyl hydrolase 1 n=1 Tax=Rotaria sordida TaxID=392033 RepID=A0A815VNP3_9BILA|nr:unnamed protein product [Rotaria sordida]CAF1535247.1 unnamed protein product [Rotaria sordida]